MKIAFYSPYLNILGGGERYILQMASVLSVKHDVTVFGDNQLKKKAENRFGIDLAKVSFLPSFFGETALSKIKKTSQFDVLFYVTDGSLFISLAKKNFLIVQVPQKEMYHNDLFTKFKLLFWPKVLVYSDYVKKYIDLWWKTNTIVFPPAIKVDKKKSDKKENVILSVGRFFPYPHTKRQDVLIETFKSIKFKGLKNKGLKNWKLVLAGGVDKQGMDYLNQIKKMIDDDSIEIRTNISNEELINLYKKAKIYWHAAGFDGDLSNHPERAEHFGITTIEAMSYGTVPLVFPAGGQLEIVQDNINGLFWQTENELREKTLNLINDEKLWNKLSNAARERSRDFGLEIFEKKLNKLLET